MRNRGRNKRLSPTGTPPTGAGQFPAPLPGTPPEAGSVSHALPASLTSMNEEAFEELPDEQESSGRMFKIKAVAMFRAGDYGPKGKYSDDDLQEMADTYDPDWLHAAITPDHVQEGIAYGWIDRVYRDGDVLRGDWSVHPEVYYAMKEGYYTRRSIEIYRGVPFRDGKKVQYVKACSILGAAVPEVKGLERIRFSEGFAPFEHYDFSETNNTPAAAEAGEQNNEEPEMDPLKNNTPAAGSTATPPAPANNPSAFAGMTEEQFNQKLKEREDLLRADYDKRLQEEQDRNARFAQSVTEINSKLRNRDEEFRFNETARKAVGEGRLPKPELDILAAVFNALPYDDAEGANVSFSSEGKEPETVPVRSLLLRYMETKAVVAPVGQDLQSSGNTAFTSGTIPTPSGAAAMDPAKRAEWIDKRALEMSEANPEKSFGDCMLAAERELSNRNNR